MWCSPAFDRTIVLPPHPVSCFRRAAGVFDCSGDTFGMANRPDDHGGADPDAAVVEACAPGIAALVDRAGPVHAAASDIGNSMTDGGFVLPDAVTFTNPLDWFVGTTDLWLATRRSSATIDAAVQRFAKR